MRKRERVGDKEKIYYFLLATTAVTHSCEINRILNRDELVGKWEGGKENRRVCSLSFHHWVTLTDHLLSFAAWLSRSTGSLLPSQRPTEDLSFINNGLDFPFADMIQCNLSLFS